VNLKRFLAESYTCRNGTGLGEKKRQTDDWGKVRVPLGNLTSEKRGHYMGTYFFGSKNKKKKKKKKKRKKVRL